MRKEHPILFKGEMVRAILNCKPGVWPAEPIDPALPFKWQTRRIVKPEPSEAGLQWVETLEGFAAWVDDNLTLDEGRHRLCPGGVPGDRLWVREALCCDSRTGRPVYAADSAKVRAFHPDNWQFAVRWQWQNSTLPRGVVCSMLLASIHMPRWASRLNLELKAVRVERVQDISIADASAEGIDAIGPDAIYAFHALWDSINAPRGYSWKSDPWVWVYDFMRGG